MGSVADQLKVLKDKVLQLLSLRIELHLRQRSGLSSQLELGQMILIEVQIAKGMNEFPRLQSGDLSHHESEEGVGGDIERDAEKEVGTPLIELATEPWSLAAHTSAQTRRERALAGGRVREGIH